MKNELFISLCRALHIEYFVTKFIRQALLASLNIHWQSNQLEHSYFEKTAIKTSYSISGRAKVEFHNVTGSLWYGLHKTFTCALENGGAQLDGSKLYLRPLTLFMEEALLSLNPALCMGTGQVWL